MRPINGSTASSTQLEIFQSNSTYTRYLYTYRWIAEKAQSPDIFRFRLVGPGEQYIHILNSIPNAKTSLEIYPFWQHSHPSSFEWKLTCFTLMTENEEEE